MVMVAGLPGKMATLVAQAIVAQKDMELYPFALSEVRGCSPFGQLTVNEIPSGSHADVLERCRGHVDVIVDFTMPTAVNHNAELYCASKIPFVMGTTGGDRQKLFETVEKSDISAIIAPNMAIPVVIFQAMFHFAASNFPGALSGFKLTVVESHQASKPDPSGTAVNLLQFFATLGMPFAKEQIVMIRDPKVQELDLAIPYEYLGGHGYHTYRILSPDDTVMLEFRHNILGRNVYVDGALRAIRFLAGQGHRKGVVFSMADVLRNSIAVW